MSNTSQWDAAGAAGKKPEGTARTGKGSSGTSMTDLSDQVSGAVREGAREVKEQASNVTESAKGPCIPSRRETPEFSGRAESRRR